MKQTMALFGLFINFSVETWLRFKNQRKSNGIRFVLTGLILFSIVSCSRTHDFVEKYKTEALNWEPAIAQFDSLNRVETYPDNSILFVGSSSIRMWETMQEDMAPYHVIQRGFGGAKYSDVAWFAERLIYPHHFKALMLFAGNDIWGVPIDKSPEEIARLAVYVVDVVRKKYPDVPIFFIEVTHSPKRLFLMRQVHAENMWLKRIAQERQNVHFIESFSSMKNSAGEPDSSLFQEDLLHLNKEGYAVWAEIIKQNVQAVLHETNTKQN